MAEDDDDDAPMIFPRSAARAPARAPERAASAPVGAAMETALQSLVDDGSLALTDDAELQGLASRLLAHLEQLDTPHIGRAISEWLLDQDEVDELYAEDGVIVETIRRNMPTR